MSFLSGKNFLMKRQIPYKGITSNSYYVCTNTNRYYVLFATVRTYILKANCLVPQFSTVVKVPFAEY